MSKTTHSVFKRSLFSLLAVSVLSVGTLGRPSVAYAGCCGEVAAIAGQTVAINAWLEKVILGTHAANPVYPVMMPKVDEISQLPIVGGEFVPMPPKGPVMGLVDYFENIFWPRMITMEQTKGQVQAKQGAAEATLGQRSLDAKQTNEFQQRTDGYRVEAAAGGLGIEDALCAHPSRTQSNLALRVVSMVRENQLADQSSNEYAGSDTNTKEGPLKFAKLSVDARAAAGTCDPAGNNGANAGWCSGGGAQKGYDLKPQMLVQPNTWDEGNASKINFINYADMYIRNVFPDRAFSPIRADLVSNKTPQFYEIQHMQDSYSAQLKMFEQPFHEAAASRKGIAGAASLSSLQAVLTRVNYPDEIKNLLIPNSMVSSAASEEIHYKIANLDPQVIVTDYAKAAALSAGAREGTSFEKLMDIVVLSYDIREQLKTTNKLLGAIGSLLAEQRYEKIEALSKGAN